MYLRDPGRVAVTAQMVELLFISDCTHLKDHILPQHGFCHSIITVLNVLTD